MPITSVSLISSSALLTFRSQTENTPIDVQNAKRIMALYDLDKDGVIKKSDFKNLANMVLSHYRLRFVSLPSLLKLTSQNLP